MKGYKATKNMKCLTLTYEVGKTYEISNTKMCSHGFHFCEKMEDTMGYYDFDKDFILLEIDNGRGEGVMISLVNATGIGGVSGTECVNYSYIKNSWGGKRGVHLRSGESYEFLLQCPSGAFDGMALGSKQKFEFDITWYSDDSTENYNHTATGEVSADIQTR